MKFVLGDFIAKVRRDNIFKLIIRDESPNQDSNDNGDRIVNFAVKSGMFPHINIFKYNFTYPYKKTHKQIDHILIDSIWHYSILHVRCIRGADCDADQCLVAAKCMESLVTNKTTT
jgi:hypothetical protein